MEPPFVLSPNMCIIKKTETCFFPIIGGHGQSELDMHATSIAAKLAKKTGGRSLSLVAPALVNNHNEKEMLLNDIQISQVIQTTAQARYALFSLGYPLANNSRISKSGYLSQKDFEQLALENAVCDVVSILFLNQDSKECCQNITQRCIGITGRQLRQIPNKICIVAGKVRAFGVSNFLPDEYRLLKSYLMVPLITNQIELSPLRMENLENRVINMCMEERIHPMLWSPLAGGRIFTDQGEEAVRLREALEIIRQEIGAEDIDEVAFAWLYSHPAGVIPITGSGEIKLAQRPVKALDYRLTPEQWFMVWTAVKGHKVL